MDEFRLRGIKDSGSPSKYLIEHAPHLQKLRVHSKDIWIYTPWMYYIIFVYNGMAYSGSTSMVKLYAAKERVKDVQSLSLGRMALPNLESGYSCCLAAPPALPNASIGQRISDAISFWWGSRFNKDYIGYQESNPVWMHFKSQCTEKSRGVSNVLKKMAKCSQEEILALPWEQRISVASSLPDMKLIDRKFPA